MSKSYINGPGSLILGTCLLALAACNDNTDGTRTGDGQQEDIGNYRAIITPLNTNLAGNPAALGIISVQGDEVSVNMGGSNFDVKESGNLQFIYTKGACPTSDNDTNGDGIIDFVEGQVEYGDALVPLDGDLNSQQGGIEEFPSSNNLGIYSYRTGGSFTELLADLRAPDENQDDTLVKLPPEEDLNLEGRTVVIHGVPDDVALPETVASPEGTDAKNTVPIACGVIERITGEDEGEVSEETPEDETTPPGEETAPEEEAPSEDEGSTAEDPSTTGPEVNEEDVPSPIP